MSTCDNCKRTYDSADGVENPFHDFCSKSCEDDFLMRFNNEKVEHPSRYNKCGIEVWDVEKAFATTKWSPFVEHLRFGAVEYLLRAPDKNGIEDIRKSMFLLDRIVKEMEAK